MGLRQALFGVGLSGLLGSSAQAQDTGYMDSSAAEIQAEVLKRAQRFRYEDFKRLEGNEDFDGVVLASSTCPKKIDGLERRNEIIFLQLMDKYQGVKSFNGDPLIFGYFDVCGRSGADLLGLDMASFVMYLDGKEIDRMNGGPANDEGMGPTLRNMSGGWIPYNLISPRDEYTYMFSGKFQLAKVSR